MGGVRTGQIGNGHVGLNAVVRLEFTGKVRESRLVAGDQQQVIAPAGEEAGIGGPDPA